MDNVTLTPYFAGCDISRDGLDICLLQGDSERHFSLPNTPQGHAMLLEKLAGTSPELVVLEASGGYESALYEALQGAGVPVARRLPQRVRQFAYAGGQLAKTDRIDAYILALFGQRMRPAPSLDEPAGQRYIKALTTRRRALLTRRIAEKCQLKQAAFEDIRAMIRHALTRLEADIRALDAQINALIEADTAWRNRARRLTSLPGIGAVTSAAMIAGLPELGRVTRGEIAALVGVAPFARQSGRWRGKRVCRGGQKDLRNTLYMAALSATRAKRTPFSALYQRLVDAGKPPKLAITAVMRKMVVTLNAMERDQKFYAI